jgi:Bifunctional DNA primase/polymerase, N-terminal/AAA domain
MTDALTAALDYAHHGLRVLPIKPGEKRPPMPAWQDAATTNPERINSWWSGLYAGHGVGIATGHGVFVLDVDISDGKAGDETLRALEDSYGPLTDTVRVITGSGGAHIYYRYPEGTEIRNDAGRKLGPGLDIRGTGGQVVAPPTLHPSSGQQYAWEDGCGLDDIEIAEAPDWLLELLTAQPDITPSVMPTVTGGDDGPAARYNDSTNWTDLLTRDGWTLSHTDRTGCQHWVRPGKDARDGTSATVNYEGRDILRVFTSSVAGLPEGAYNRFGYTAAMHHNGDRSAFASELVRQEDRGLSLTPFVPAGMPAPHTRVELAHLVDWARFWEDDHSDEEWLAYPIIPTGRAIALYAPAKAGKSTIVLAIAAAVATGRPVLGRRIHPTTEVLYLDYEMTPADLQQRLLELGYSSDDDLSHLHYALLPSMPPLDTVEGATALLELCDLTGAELVVVDTFGRAVEGEEDHADTVRDFYRHTGLSLKARGITYLRTDHSGKDVAKGMRGSSAKNDDVDLVWQLSRTDTKDGHGVLLKRTHSRISWIPEQVKINRTETDDGFTYVHDIATNTYPDGTRQDMDILTAHGIDAAMTQNKAIKIIKAAETSSGTKILSRRRIQDAHRMMVELVAQHTEIRQLTPFLPRRRGENGSGAVARHSDSGAVGSESGAVGAPKGRKGSESGAVEGTNGAPNVSPTGAPPPYKGGAPGPPPEHDLSPTGTDDSFNLF